VRLSPRTAWSLIVGLGETSVFSPQQCPSILTFCCLLFGISPILDDRWAMCVWDHGFDAASSSPGRLIHGQMKPLTAHANPRWVKKIPASPSPIALSLRGVAADINLLLTRPTIVPSVPDALLYLQWLAWVRQASHVLITRPSEPASRVLL
jgi:hypothetical protein